jgi:Xaa-Pro aminopeptidase
MSFDDIQRRIAYVREKMAEQHLDALLISDPANRYYLTGFYAYDDGQDSAGRVVLTSKHCALLTDVRFTEQAHTQTQGIEIIDKRARLPNLVSECLESWGWQSGDEKHVLGIEANHLTVAHYQALAEGTSSLVVLHPTVDIVEPLRAIKDEMEVALTRRATEITVQTFAHLQTYLCQPGLRERDVAAEITATMLRLGADGLAFSSIVASGPNSALPHAMPSDRELQPGEPIIIDMGARYKGYCADMTRTVFLDNVPAIWAERYQHLLTIQEQCLAQSCGDMVGNQLDNSVRTALNDIGLAAYFTHGLGHGTGLEIHEAPYIVRKEQDEILLPTGAIITIEPGVYFTGAGGIRIEDAIVLAADGYENLSTAPKDLAAMVIQRH